MTATHLILQAAHWLAGWIVLFEALNKLHRTDAFRPDFTTRQRLVGLLVVLTPWRWKRPVCVTSLKLLAWALMAYGAFGVIVAPFRGQAIGFQEAAIACGFAVLIVRTRLKEA